MKRVRGPTERAVLPDAEIRLPFAIRSDRLSALSSSTKMLRHEVTVGSSDDCCPSSGPDWKPFNAPDLLVGGFLCPLIPCELRAGCPNPATLSYGFNARWNSIDQRVELSISAFNRFSSCSSKSVCVVYSGALCTERSKWRRVLRLRISTGVLPRPCA